MCRFDFKMVAIFDVRINDLGILDLHDHALMPPPYR